MNMKTEIQNAVGSHGKWKGRLRKAIETGKIDATLSTIKLDTECDFGKWLYGLTAEEKEKQSGNYQKVQQLHATFHEEASRVVQLVQSGNKAAAMRLLDVTGGFTAASGDLTAAMLTWLTEVK